MTKYDIIIIGAGAAGLNIASFMNKIGLKVLLIDKTEKNIGGDCLNFGCVPSKALIHVSKLIYSANESEKFGLRANGKVDMKKVRDYIKSKQQIIRKHENASYLKSKGIDILLGEASFSGKNSVIVNGKKYFSKKIVIATGSVPRKLKIPGISKANVYTNETIFNLETLPKRLLIIGGGPIGIELAQAFNRLGSKVTVVEVGSKFLPKENPEITKILLGQLKQEGINFYFNSSVKEIIGKSMIIENAKSEKFRETYDAILVAIGRKLNIPKGLGNANVKTEEGKIVLDKYLRTTNKNIYVSGDASAGLLFTHATELHARVIINNLISIFKKNLSYDNFSWVTYTDPEIATFGLTEEELINRNIKYEKLVQDLNSDDRAIVDNATGKLILYLRKNKILGGTMIAPNAGEIIQELILAKSSSLKLKELFNKIYAYPVASRVNKEIVAKYLSRSLTPFTKRLLRLFFNL